MLSYFSLFYKAAVDKKISLSEFTFDKNPIDKFLKNFLFELVYHIAIFIYQVNIVLPTLNDIKEFLHQMEFLNKFYLFLKDNEEKLNSQLFDVSKEDTVKRIFMQEKYQKPQYPSFREIANRIGFANLKQTIVLDEYIKDAFEICLKVLFLIIYLNERPSKKEEVENILFQIHFELYEYMMPGQFEDFKKQFGILHQIEWLKQNIELVRKAQKHPAPYFN